MINSSRQAQLTDQNLQPTAFKGTRPTHNIIPFGKRLLNQTQGHQISPNAPTKATMEEKMIYRLLPPITESA